MGSQDYRERADALRREASRAKSRAVREQLLLMAADWDRLAEAAPPRDAAAESRAD
jgi:hypothetical protein